MGQPGKFAPPGGEDWIGRKFAELERQFRELAAANVFGTTGITPQDGGTDFDGYVNVNGPMEVNGASTINGPQTVNGSMSITGALNLPAGIIGNDALANPVKTGSAGYTASNQAFSASGAVYGTQTITVPAGFTAALVMNGVSGGGTNSSGAGDYIYVSSDINGSPGGETPTYAAAGLYASASAYGVRTLSGLVGGQTITVGVRVRTGSAAWAAAGANVVNVNALALFYR